MNPSGRRLVPLRRWFDNDAVANAESDTDSRIDWLRTLPFAVLHLACFGVIWVGVSETAVMIAVGLYLARMFAVTGFYHRYLAHKAYRTSRLFQFLLAVLAASATQRGPLWWASHHRHHHAHSDRPEDVHSPLHHGFVWSHMGWFLSRANFHARLDLVKDWARFPELRFLDRFDTLVPLLLAAGLFALGELLAAKHPELRTNGPQLLVWGFAVSTVALYHATFTVNSLAHVWGRRRFATRDGSRNNFCLAVLTLGEGWHNNHHHFPGSARQGFRWWEIDPTFYVLWLLAKSGLIWDLRPLPRRLPRRLRGGDSASLPAEFSKGEIT